MCGRFTLTHSTRDVVGQFVVKQTSVELKPRFNIAPSQPVAVVLQQQSRSLEAFKWGLVPFWAKEAKIGNRLINARAETLGEKPAFRAALKPATPSPTITTSEVRISSGEETII